MLTAPLAYAAQSISVEKFLAALNNSRPPRTFPQRSPRQPKAEQEYGLTRRRPRSSCSSRSIVCTCSMGARTAPGDQVFVQVTGNAGATFVDAEF